MSDLDYDDDDISGNEYNEVEERGSDEGKLTDLNNVRVFLSKRMKRSLTSRDRKPRENFFREGEKNDGEFPYLN